MQEFVGNVFQFLILLVIFGGLSILFVGGKPLARKIGKKLGPLWVSAESIAVPAWARVILARTRFILICLMAAYIVYLVVGTTYHAVDDAGWVPHTKVVTVFVKANLWISGEYKTCYSPATKQANELTFLACGNDSETHDLNVKFWGTLTTDSEKTWNCQRSEGFIPRETALTCKLQ